MELEELQERLSEAGIVLPELDRALHCEAREWSCWPYADAEGEKFAACEFSADGFTSCGADNDLVLINALVDLIFDERREREHAESLLLGTHDGDVTDFRRSSARCTTPEGEQRPD